MQHTLRNSYSFEGKGLHTGAFAHMTIRPAEENAGIVFVRSDISREARVHPLACNVSSTARCTTISEGETSVSTIEHIMSAAAGLGIDNMLVEIDGPEVPILDGSAMPYVSVIMADELQEQDAPRKYFEISESFHYEDAESGATIDILPADSLSVDLTADFNSKVLGVQHFRYDSGTDYAAEIAPCRTFCFFHELEFLASKGLIKGGDVENAIVIVEHPVDDATLARMQELFGVGRLEVCQGYLNNLSLHFPDEIVRHKTLDLLGDFALLGAPLKGTIIACKTGHRINSAVCRILSEKYNK